MKQVMLLAAGRGTRLGSLGQRIAKALVEVDGRPLLSHQLGWLARQGVERVCINGSHLAEQLTDYADRYRGPLELSVSLEREPLGTAGGVLAALPVLEPGTLGVLYADVLIDVDLEGLATMHRRSGAAATLSAYASAETLGKGVLDVDAHNRIRAFKEKDSHQGPGLINAGLYVLETKWLEQHRAEPPLDFGFDVFPAAVKKGDPLYCYELATPVIDIGTPEGLEQARLKLQGR
jgi:NDP-sugar pyrophosphorylase family protein